MITISLKDQWNKIKDNWLIFAIIGVALLVMFSSQSVFDSVSYSLESQSKSSGYAESFDRSMYPGGYDDFAPDETERKITKTSSLGIQVEKGAYDSAESTLRNIASGTDSFILNQNVRSYGTGWRLYKQGSYTIKVETGKYDVIIPQLQAIGKVLNFVENSRDITGSYTNTGIEIETERLRLSRYESMYERADKVADQITLSDRIFDQERKIRYLEDSLTNLDRRIEYSTISFSLQEKRSEWAGVEFVKIQALITRFVLSLNSLLTFIFVIIPWAVMAGILWLGIHLIRKRR